MTIQLFAQPYNRDAQGFYFSSYEEYTEKQENLRDAFGNVVEEFEIQHIEGAEEFADIVKPDQCNIEEWFEWAERYDDLSSSEQYAFKWLVDDLNRDADEAFDKVGDVIIFEGSASDYAYEFVNECYDIERMMGSRSDYFDYDAFARDLVLSGDICEIERGVFVINPHDF